MVSLECSDLLKMPHGTPVERVLDSPRLSELDSVRISPGDHRSEVPEPPD